MIRKNLPVNLGWLNWMRRFEFLKPIVCYLSVRKVEQKLKKAGIPYSKTESKTKTIFEADLS